jgi:hypothetical protein
MKPLKQYLLVGKKGQYQYFRQANNEKEIWKVYRHLRNDYKAYSIRVYKFIQDIPDKLNGMDKLILMSENKI